MRHPRRLLFWLLFSAGALVLHLKNLGETALWQDEAETAVVARNTARFGLPTVWDGRNLASQNRGQDHDARLLQNYIPWLSFYVAAASFILLGAGTFSARLPFALLGVLNLLWIRRLALRWSGRDSVADAALWLSLLNVPLLLFSRQCRYYSLGLLFVLYAFDSYERFLESKPRSGLHLTASAAGLFYSSYVYFYLAAGGMALHYALFGPKKLAWVRPRLPWLAAAAAALVPGLIYFQPFQRAAAEAVILWPDRLDALRQLLRDVDLQLAPLALIPGLFLLPRQRLKAIRAPLVYLAAGLLLLALSPRYFFRYLLPLLPLALVATAEIAAELYRRSRAWAGAFAGLLLFTHAFCLSFWLGGERFLRTDLADYFHEITHPFPEPIKAASDYLNANAGPDDLLLVTYPDLPFMFYTPLKVIGGSSGAHRFKASDARWVLLRDDAEKAQWPLDFSRYERIELSASNAPWGNRPDPVIHRYRPPKTPAPAVIYRLRK